MKFTIGKPISSQLSEYLMEWTNEKDVIAVAAQVNMSYSTVRDLRRGQNNVTDNNQQAIISLVQLAAKNCNNKLAYAKQSMKFFDRLQNYFKPQTITL